MKAGTRHEIMLTLYKCTDFDKHYYTQPRRQKIQELLTRFYAKAIGIRWQTQCIKDLVDNGLINRRVRYVHYEGGLIRQIPSLFSFTLKGFKYLAKYLVTGAQQIVDQIEKWLEEIALRSSTADRLDLDQYRKLHAEEMKRLKRLPAI